MKIWHQNRTLFSMFRRQTMMITWTEQMRSHFPWRRSLRCMTWKTCQMSPRRRTRRNRWLVMEGDHKWRLENVCRLAWVGSPCQGPHCEPSQKATPQTVVRHANSTHFSNNNDVPAKLKCPICQSNDIKGCICHFVKCQIHLFISKGTIYCAHHMNLPRIKKYYDINHAHSSHLYILQTKPKVF